MNLQILEKQINWCDKCSDILSKYGISVKPIFEWKSDFEIILIWQAPWISEYNTW